MSYGFVFVALSLAFVGLFFFGHGDGFDAWWLCLWPALVFAYVSVAYTFYSPRLIGKRKDGSFPLWRRILLAPFVVYSEGIWHLYARVTKERPYDQVVPGLWVGRWPGARALPEGAQIVIDVTAELPAHRSVLADRTYVCLPALDATTPDYDELTGVVSRFSWERRGIFVHCAFGHSRSALVAAGLLVARRLAKDGEEAVAMLKSVRPRVRLNADQRAYLERLVKSTRRM